MIVNILQIRLLCPHQKLCHGHSFGIALPVEFSREKNIINIGEQCSTIAYLTSSSLDTSKLFDSE